MAYEMLTGYTVFSDRSPQQMLVAHAVETPERVEKRRPSVPPALASLVMNALEKHAADRPQSADEMLAMLDSVATSSAATSAPMVASDSGWKPVAGFTSEEGKTHKPSRRRFSSKHILTTLAALTVVAVIAFVFSTKKTGGTPQALDRDLVVVVPFRVGGAEASLAYLREGMLDLLAAKLNGEGGPRAADPRSVLSAWRRVSPSATEDLSASDNVRLAANLGAGQVILGGIVGTPARLVVNATVYEVPSGTRIRDEVSVTGPADSLALLVDQLAVKLLSLQAGEDQQNLAQLASSSLPAIRAYLDGKAEYRRGRYEAASNHFNQALDIDSTFALAGVDLIVSANWAGLGNLIATGVKRAWESREKLTQRDRMLVLAYAGPNFPVIPSISGWRKGLDSAVKLGPDQPDVLYEYGDMMWHFGGSIGIPSAMNVGSEMFARAFSRDSSFAPAIEHLVDHAANRGDAASVARLTARYLALDSAADHATYIRWRASIALGDSAALREVRKSFPGLDLQNAGRIAGTAMLEGVGLGDADAVASALLDVSGAGKGRGAEMSLTLALNRGRQKAARELHLAEMRRAPNNPFAAATLLDHILYWDANRSDALEAAGIVERYALGPVPAGRKGRKGEGRMHIAACAVGQWRLSNNDLKGVRELLPILRRTLPAAQKWGYVTTDPTCLPFLEATTQMTLEPSSIAAKLSKLDTLSLKGSRDFFWLPLNIELARLFDASGNPRKGLEVIRRRPYHWGSGTAYLTTQLREEGRLAAKAGDTQGAIRAYSHYLRLRENPDASLVPQADSVRSALQQLGVATSRR